MTSLKRKEAPDATETKEKKCKPTDDKQGDAVTNDPARVLAVTGSITPYVTRTSPYGGPHEAFLRCIRSEEKELDARTQRFFLEGHQQEPRGCKNLQAFLDEKHPGAFEVIHSESWDAAAKQRYPGYDYIAQSGGVHHPRYPFIRVLVDGLVFDVKTCRLVGLAELKYRASCAKEPVPRDAKKFFYYFSQAMVQASCVNVPTVYLTVSSDADFAAFPLEYEEKTWMGGDFQSIAVYYELFLSWAYEANEESKKYVHRVIAMENARFDRRVPIREEDVWALEKFVQPWQKAAMKRVRAEDKAFQAAVKGVDFCGDPIAPTLPPNMQDRFLLRISKIRALEGLDEKFCPRPKALREALHFGVPSVAEDGGEGAGAYFAKIRARLPDIEKAVGDKIVEHREFVRSTEVPFVCDFLTYRLESTGQPVLVHYLQKPGAISSYTTGSVYYTTPDECVAAFLLPAEMSDRSAISVFVNADDIKLRKIVYSDSLRAGYLRRVRAVFNALFKWHWTTDVDRDHEAFVSDLLRKPVTGGRTLTNNEIDRLMNYKELDESERERVCQTLRV